MANVKHIRGDNEGSDEVSDPQYELFLASLKKYKKSYVVKGNINDVSVRVKYEGRKLKPKCSERRDSRVMKGRDVIDSDIDIIDSATFYRVGNPVQTVREDSDIELRGRTSPRFNFRRQVMDVLLKPYDKWEGKTLREAFIAGSYVKFHPVLVNNLTVRRREKGKCLALLRGFFFWLENLTQDGSFKPWLDGECLEVDPTLHLYQHDV